MSAKANDIYGEGPLLHAVQMSGLFPDSKTFVDKKLKFPPAVIQNNFNAMVKLADGKLTTEDIRAFVEKNFDPEGSEFEPWEPTDWVENPHFLSKISDPLLRGWAQELHGLWKELGRKVKTDVRDNPELYSQIYVPNPVIVPGGRFTEVYYWDSFWIVQGLLLSGMYKTVRGILDNFLLMVKKYGLVPNGGRTYYTHRSQPPMLIPMTKRYLDYTKDLGFLRNNIQLLEKEFLFWMENRTVTVHVNGEAHRLARYNVEHTGPRPESYREDYESASVFSSEEEKEQFYNNIKAAAESGWDFSSRWFIKNGTNQGELCDIKTSDLLPVDLNAYLYLNATYLSKFYAMLKMKNKARHYQGLAVKWQQAVTKVLWDENRKIWLDYDIKNKRRRDYLYLSNTTPLWTGCYDPQKKVSVTRGVVNYLRSKPCLEYPYGIPTSMYPSNQQWDFPNAWAPLQHMVVMGLDGTGVPEAQELAFQLAKKWVLANFAAYYETHPQAMFEKYDVRVGRPGHGGEYVVQTGFGWTNGVILEFLDRYGDKIFVVSKTSSSFGTIKNIALASLEAMMKFSKKLLRTTETRRTVTRHPIRLSRSSPNISQMLQATNVPVQNLLLTATVCINGTCPVV